MSSNRRIVCEAAFGFGPFDTLTSTDWVELIEAGRPRIKEATWSFGRDDELEHFQPGTATILLSNRDRHLDPDNPSSPHAGDLLPYVPVRLRSKNEATGSFQDEFYGFVVGGWEQVLAPKRTGDVRLELVDYLGVLAGYTLPDVFEAAVLAHNPVGFWILDGSGETVADLGSGHNDGETQGEGVTLGDRILTPGHRPAARFDCRISPETDDQSTAENVFGSVYMGRSPIIATDATSLQNALLMVTFLARSAPQNETAAADELRVLFCQSNGNGPGKGNGLAACVIQRVTAGVVPGMLLYGVQSTLTAATLGTVVDGRPHLMFGSNETLALDSATLSTPQTFGYSIPKVNGVGIGGGPGLQSLRHFDGWIGAAALFASASTVGLSGRQEILDAHSKLDGETSGIHIAWALDQLGVPSGKRNLATGTVVMGPADAKGKDAVTWMREVTATEGGGLYVDHRDGGKIRFTNRYHRFLASNSVTPQGTFTDDPDTNPTVQIRYPPEGLQVASNGLDGIINQVTATWAGGEVMVTDAASVAAYGPRQRTLETVATTPGQAQSAAEWLVARYKDPRSRIRSCVATSRHTQDRHDIVQALRIDDRVTFRVHPLHTGTATSVSLFVDGVSHAARGLEWETSFRFAQVDTFTPWVWGTSEWGNDTYWG